MKFLFIVLFVLFGASLNAQIPKNGIYTYNWCDIEYNKCLGKCKIKIKGNKIWIYAPANLSGIKEGELYDTGILLKNSSGKWIIVHPNIDENIDEPSLWIDFKKKQFWTF